VRQQVLRRLVPEGWCEAFATSSGGLRRRQRGDSMARILVVDDDISIRLAVRMILENAGHTVVVAEGGHAAVSAIEAFSFDVLVVDIFMPGMDGLETIKIFRENAPEVPIIAMSGYAVRGEPMPDFFRKALDLGAALCLYKPFRNRELINAIDTCRSGGGAMVA
jgi:CheY-like chemotaxis protein